MTPELRPAPRLTGESNTGRDGPRLALIHRIADDLAHEIRNPLNAIVINLEVLRRRAADEDHVAVQERVAVLGDEVRRLHRLVDDLLRLLRPAREDEEPASIGELMDTVLTLLGPTAGAARTEMRPVTGDGDAVPTGHPSDLRFALLHVYDLALRPMDGGEIRTHVHAEDRVVQITISFPCRMAAGDFAGAVQDGVVAAAELLSVGGGRVEVVPPDAAGTAVLRVVIPRTGPA